MSHDLVVAPPRAERGGAAAHADPRVAAVLEVLGGRARPEVARRYAVEVAVLARWVQAFVAAGTANLTNHPDPQQAHQRDRFLAAFAHEIRTPLTTARGWAELLATDDEGADATHRIRLALDRLTERTRDVELLSAAALGRLELQPAPTTVGELITGLPGVDAVRAEERAIVLTVDPAHLRRVLRDLWSAAGLAPAPRMRMLRAAVVGPWVELRVVRTGSPIPPSVLQALFDPFDVNDDGTGVTIGLYLARALTVAHGGMVGADQDEDSVAFWVRVPARPHIREVVRRPVPPLEES